MEAILKKEVLVNKVACRVIGVAAFVVLTMLGAFVRIPLPFTPVPLTLQTLFVLLASAFLGKKLGVLSQGSYVLLGAIGLPLFTGTAAGLLYIFGPTGGYLLGFILASLAVGSLLKHAKNFISSFLIFALADSLLLLTGAFWLKLTMHLNLGQALFLGFLPFIAGDIVKIFLATLIYQRFNARAKEIF